MEICFFAAMVNEGVLVLERENGIMGVETVTVRPIIVVILLKLKRCLLQMVDSERLELLLYLELPVDDMKNGTVLSHLRGTPYKRHCYRY